MTNDELMALVEQLDWNCDPKPSPYQYRAWRVLLREPADAVLPLLRIYEAKLRTYKGFYPYSYTRAYERCVADGTTNI